MRSRHKTTGRAWSVAAGGGGRVGGGWEGGGGRVIEDYMVLYFGSSMFKIARLIFVALLSVHFFACAFYRVKNDSASSPEDVQTFYISRGVDPSVGPNSRFCDCGH